MPTAFLLAPLTLIAVLVLSAIPKLRGPDSFISAVGLLRLPRFLRRRWFARALPAAELALALALLSPWSWLFSTAACACVALFLGYWAIIARALTFSPRPSCGCFGKIGNHTVSARTLARNSLLLVFAAATFALAVSGSSVFELLSSADLADLLWVAMAAMIAVLVWLIVGGAPTEAESPIGAPAPARAGGGQTEPGTQNGVDSGATNGDAPDEYEARPFPLTTVQLPDGGIRTLHELTITGPRLLLAVNCACSPTLDVIGRIPKWTEEIPKVGIELMSHLTPKQLHDAAGFEGSLYDHAGSTWAALGLEQSPAAVLLGADGQIAGGPVYGTQEIGTFVEDIALALAEIESA